MPKKKEIPFEQKIKTLQEIVTQLEKNETSLEDTLALYKKGINLSKECSTFLQQAEKEIKILLQDEKQNV